jgi:hypothetical protein
LVVDWSDQIGVPVSSLKKIESGDAEPIRDDPPPVCGNCGGEIDETDVTCPHCGISLVAG